MAYTTPELTLVGAAQNLVLGLVSTSHAGDLCFIDNPEPGATSDTVLSW